MIARFIASLLRFPVCNSCGAVEWSSAERAYALGWRLGSHQGAAHGEGATVVLCPECVE